MGSIFNAVERGDLENLKKIALELTDEGALVKTFTKLKDDKGRTALHVAVRKGMNHICQYLTQELKLDINLRDDIGNTPLHHAVLAQQLSTGMFLIENGANPKFANERRFTALHYAAEEANLAKRYGTTPKHTPKQAHEHIDTDTHACARTREKEKEKRKSFVSLNLIEIMELLISKGADIEAESSSGTPLVCAAAKGNEEAVKLLLERNANPNVIGKCATPLALSLVAGSNKCTKLLLKAGADPNQQSRYGLPLLYAARVKKAQAINYLLKAGADPNVTDPYGMTPLELAALGLSLHGVSLLLDVTNRIPDIPDPAWSILGIVPYVLSDRYLIQRAERKMQAFLPCKSKGDEALERKDYNDAIYWFTAANISDPSNAEVLSSRSLCWACLDQGVEALSDAVECVRLKPDWANAHYREGVGRKMIKDFSGSVEAFSKALELDPGNQEIRDAHREAVEAEVSRISLV